MPLDFYVIDCVLQRIDAQCVAKRLIMRRKTARFMLRNGPFCSALWAILPIRLAHAAKGGARLWRFSGCELYDNADATMSHRRIRA